MKKWIWSNGERSFTFVADDEEAALRRVIAARLETADGDTPEERLAKAYEWFIENDTLEEAHDMPLSSYEGDLGPFEIW